MSAPEQPSASSQTASPARSDNLALVFQEILTVIVRLRTARQKVPDAEVFRRQVLNALKVADRNAREKGYPDEDIDLAKYAVVAFLDESVLNLQSPTFREWVRKPLQEELFGRHVAGETYFHNLKDILGRRDTETTADLLEVYELCLLLGYLGRYSIAGRGELRSLIGEIEDKIQRIRRSRRDLSPRWRLPPGAAEAPRDKWAMPMLAALVASIVLSLCLFLGYSLSLSGGVESVRDLAGQAPAQQQAAPAAPQPASGPAPQSAETPAEGQGGEQ